ncbi:putative porin [Ferruginibacter albus]|uniref:putative porin n=1 Tax=Ferruginibacter albus TaxID=2875540 RepID=UPI001CC62D4A|nr:putative porin [Ferruginibacter albus]UAY51361.1 putative porin [Ferruginibacter albus]
MKRLIIFCCCLLFAEAGIAQLGNILTQGTGSSGNNSPNDSTLGFTHRDPAADSVAISFKYLDSIRNNPIDSSVNDFSRYYNIPSDLQYLGNTGNAGYDLIYSPITKTGWDAGYHAFDAYRYTLQNTKFYKTSKPFSQIDYLFIGPNSEQDLHAFYTNSIKKNLNIGLEYKLISAPGFFVTQNTNHNSYRLFGNYQGVRKRYSLFFTMVGNTIKSSENGGLISDTFLNNKLYPQLFTIPVQLGGAVGYSPNPFNTSIATGNIYKDLTLFLRQTYDIGKKDSVEINDSTTEYLFYPKLRFQHSLTFSTYSYQFTDNAVNTAFAAYQQWYNLDFPSTVTSFTNTTKWKVISNDFSLLQFPDTKNQAQFFLAGARLENITGSRSTATNLYSSSSDNYSYYNIVLHAEYRNKTKNKLWDIEANGALYSTGVNSGDYNIYATLSRYLNKKFGNVRLTFNNINRSQSFIFDPLYSFNKGTTINYSKENITALKATAENPFINLFATNYFITNYAYFTDYYHTAQYSGVINLLQLGASKTIKLNKHWNWYIDAVLQQTDGAAPIRVPLFYTRNRIAYEGLFYKNLNVSTGIEFRYYTPYKGYNYSPVVGQFTLQDSVSISNRPEISAFLQFRIKTFSGFLRVENLNTLDGAVNYAAPLYAYPGFMIRFGIRWWFAN